MAKQFWVKLRLTESEQSREVDSILLDWKRKKTTPTHFMRAIQLYKALLDGDARSFLALLERYFPGFGLGASLNIGILPRSISAAPKVEVRIMTVDEIQESALSALDDF